MGKSNLLTDIIKKNGTLYATLSAIGGFVGDVLQPLAPLSEYIFYIFSAVSLLLLLTYFIIGGTRERIASFLILSITILIVSGGIFGLQSVTKSENGILSDTVPAIESFQSSLGILEKGIADIKKDTTEIKKSTKEISTKIDSLGKKIGKQGGIISNPSTLKEYYSNARNYELQGDFINSRKSYLKYFTYKKDYIDPHLNFFKLLKIQEGRSGARETYADLKEMYPSIAVEVIYALSLGKNKKIKYLEKLATQNPTYSPIIYFLSKEYSMDKLGEQTLSEKKLEKKYLEKFIGMVNDGAYLKYYLDKNSATGHVEDAQIRLTSILAASKDSSLLDDPVDIGIYFSDRHLPALKPKFMHISFYISEKVTDISYSLKKDGEFETISNVSNSNPENGSIKISTPSNTKEIFNIFVKYKDIKNQEHGPYDLSFIPYEKYRYMGKLRLIKYTDKWMNIFDNPQQPVEMSVSNLRMFQESIRKISYGINKKIPDIEINIPECIDIRSCKYFSHKTSLVKLDSCPKYISAQLEFYDNNNSEIVLFKPRYNCAYK